MASTYTTARDALLKQHLVNGGKKPDHPFNQYYFARHEDNLIPGISADTWEAIKGDLGGGSGDELTVKKRGNKISPPKFDALYSSSALCINTFAPWKLNPRKLSICGMSGFKEMQFERKMDTGFIGVPNLDLFLKSDSHVIACESKFMEFVDKLSSQPDNEQCGLRE